MYLLLGDATTMALQWGNCRAGAYAYGSHLFSGLLGGLRVGGRKTSHFLPYSLACDTRVSHIAGNLSNHLGMEVHRYDSDSNVIVGFGR